MAEVQREFVSSASPTMARAGSGGHPCQGVYHRPAGASPKVAVIATHYEVDFSEHYLAYYMAARGIGFLGWNTRYRGGGPYFLLESALVDIGVGLRWLREKARATTIVILGNSGGASLMGAYQSQAQQPIVHPGVGLRLPDAVLALPRGDLFISLCAHPGRPDVLTSWLDPSVTDELDPLSTDPSLDMFDPANGPPYSAEFLGRYRAAQLARNDRISAWCHREIERLGAGGGWDRLFAVPRVWADPRFLDLSLDPSDRPVGCYAGDPRAANRGPYGLAGTSTLRSWLSMWSMSESQCRATPHLSRIALPSLVVQSTADQGCFPSDAKTIHDLLASTDKQLVMVPGDHYLTEPASARDEVADLIVAWITDRAA